MGLYKYKPVPSGRMGILWTLSTIREAAVIEFGCMGHMLYARAFLNRAGVLDGCRLYSTHIDETDIALGRIDRIRKTISSVIKKDRPKVIFLTPSSIPEVIGTDLFAVSQELEEEFPEVKLIPFGFGGFDIVLHRGVGETLLTLAKALVKKESLSEKPVFNIIGSCADLYRFQEDSQEMVRLLRGTFGMEPVCIMTSDTSVSDIERMGQAHFNLVVRREGEPCGEFLKNEFGTPYFAGSPYGVKGTVKWLFSIAEVTGLEPDVEFIERETEQVSRKLEPVLPYFRHISKLHPEEAVIFAGGHRDVVEGILRFAMEEFGFSKGVCWCDCPYMGSEELPYFGEGQWEPAVKGMKKGILMGSGEVLKAAGKSRLLQIANPDDRWNLSSRKAPYVGFEGAVYLAELWINELSRD